MQPTAYTIARWRVTPGQEEAFRTAWVALVETLGRLARPPLCGTLLQHGTDSTLFFSFGPWADARDIEALCHDPAGQDAFLRVTELCTEAEPGIFRLVERIESTLERPEEGVRTTRVRRAVRKPDRRRTRSAPERDGQP